MQLINGIKKILIALSVILVLTSCNLPLQVPTNAPPRRFLSITAPHDGDIITSIPVSLTLDITTLGGGGQSLMIEQTSTLAGNNKTYGPIPLNSSVNRQTINVPEVGYNMDGDNIFGLMTFTGVATMSNGSTARSAPVTVCVTVYDRNISSPVPDYGFSIIDDYYCLPALFPEMTAEEWARQIYVASMIQIRGDRCPDIGNQLILQILAETTASHRVSRVTADIRVFGDAAFVPDYTHSTVEMERVGLSDFWELGFNLSTNPTDRFIPDGYTSVEVIIRAYDRENVEQASDTKIIGLPTCTPGQKDSPQTITPTSTFTPIPAPTKKKEEDEPQEPVNPPTSCPPTILCG